MVGAMARIGLTVVFAIVITATQAVNFRYSAQDYEYSGYRNFSRQHPKLMYELVNPRLGAEFKRVSPYHDLHFYVFNPGNLDRRPAIRVPVKEGKPPKRFLLSEMQFSINRGRSIQYMDFTVKFYDDKVKAAVQIKINLFKEPTDTNDINHAEDMGVPTIQSPIPERILPQLDTNPSQYDFQYFIGDLSWIDPILRRAVKVAVENRPIPTHEYWAGPAIVDEETFDMIVRLDQTLSQNASCQ